MEKIVKKLVGDRWRDAHVRECLWEGCGEEFKATITEIRKGYGRFCSQSCAARHTNARKKLHNLICEICGDPFQNVMPQTKYCGHSCRRHQKAKLSKEYQSKRENHVYHFSGKIRKKYGRLPCMVKNCGPKGEGCGWTTEFLEAHDITCDIHHITPRSQGGDDSYSNLVPMCQNAHKLADKGHISRERMVTIADYVDALESRRFSKKIEFLFFNV